ncbi:MAG TPA: tRNA epoxyqueuosine(34) reductase QueG [archaeon]|nr:tRNA epoxyqueuosine(34) reductase QueG [archaeon]
MVSAEWVKEQGRAVGFDRVGIAPATELPELALFPEWLERGYAGAMDYLQNPKRRDVRELLPEARSAICGALVYDTEQPRSTEVPPDRARGWISRYAWGDDYHSIMEKKLEALRARLAERAGNNFQGKLYVDTGPVLERVYAAHAGLGWQGKNTCLLDAELGSFFFLGVLVTNLALAPDAPLADQCGACTLCLEACPTGALVEPYVMDARRCISYLTIELRDAIPEEFRSPLGRHVFGCDICQDVCPYNRKAGLTQIQGFEPCQSENRNSKSETRAPDHESPVTSHQSLFHPPLAWLVSLTEEEFKQVFRQSAVRRAKHRGLVRNALVAMGNSGNPKFRPVLEKFAASPDPLLAEHAKWALAQLAVRTKG